MDRTARLICEGRCNPGLAELDAERRDATAHLRMPDAVWFAAHRQLRHTLHAEQRGPFLTSAWACTVCGTVRKW
jgi:hypothetical protein